MMQLEINSTTTPILSVESTAAPRGVSLDVVGFTLEVLGTPAPKGSARAFWKAGMKRAVVVKDNGAKQQHWDSSVRAAVLAVLGERETPLLVDVPIRVDIEFRLVRPGGHWGKGKRAGTLLPSAPRYPGSRLDVDKLARATLDTLTGSAWDDDGRVVDLHVRKVWAAPGREGATIRVEAMP